MILSRHPKLKGIVCHNCLTQMATLTLRLDNGNTQLSLCDSCYAALAWIVRNWSDSGPLALTRKNQPQK